METLKTLDLLFHLGPTIDPPNKWCQLDYFMVFISGEIQYEHQCSFYTTVLPACCWAINIWLSVQSYVSLRYSGFLTFHLTIALNLSDFYINPAVAFPPKDISALFQCLIVSHRFACILTLARCLCFQDNISSLRILLSAEIPKSNIGNAVTRNIYQLFVWRSLIGLT